jgi:hypothetical protein
MIRPLPFVCPLRRYQFRAEAVVLTGSPWQRQAEEAAVRSLLTSQPLIVNQKIKKPEIVSDNDKNDEKRHKLPPDINVSF